MAADQTSGERVIPPSRWVLIPELGYEIRVDTDHDALIRFRRARRPGSAPPAPEPTAP